ncbi:hypothetical protein KIN20_015169 [Parelaphostrongylus tenuis]|uniref:Uncharacterized protein n=1 Tax=Parelaphostrongylus tenuis TaxID=148309 RepID=A0AAD5QNT5_PARTN|nr:hypothetical protein KIN20_015169 [Parelaphostrongylus tenuis]
MDHGFANTHFAEIDESLTVVQGGVVLDCRKPVDYELLMRGAGTTSTLTGSVADDVVMDLIDELLNEGRHFSTDNWYTSVARAERLAKKPVVDWNMQKD